MKRMLHAVLTLVLVLGLGGPVAAGGAGAEAGTDNMRRVGGWDDEGRYRMGTDIAFWGKTAVLGRYDGLTVMDVSDPSQPAPLASMTCNGNQSDVSIWRNLVFVSVDSPMGSDRCDAAAAPAAQYASGQAWEGIRIVDISDPAAPHQVGTVYTDCGSHTHTLVPDLNHRDWVTGERDPRVLLYSSSYPLGGQGIRCNAASHRRISVVEVPLRDPSRARVITTPDVSPAVGCHDITVFLPRKLAVAACISESQVWDISDPARPVVLSRITNPTVQIHHSSAVSWDGAIAVIGDEMGGAAAAAGCTAGGQAPTGALYFYDISDPVRPRLQSRYVIGNNETTVLCTAHNFNVVPVRSGKRILVTAWYNGGTHVLDFTDATAPTSLGWNAAAEGTRTAAWSSYWYDGHIYVNNFDAGYIPSIPESRGLDVLAIEHDALRDALPMRRLNAQTQEPLRGLATTLGPVAPEVREQAIAARALAADLRVPAPPATGVAAPFCVLAGASTAVGST